MAEMTGHGLAIAFWLVEFVKEGILIDKGSRV